MASHVQHREQLTNLRSNYEKFFNFFLLFFLAMLPMKTSDFWRLNKRLQILLTSLDISKQPYLVQQILLSFSLEVITLLVLQFGSDKHTHI